MNEWKGRARLFVSRGKTCGQHELRERWLRREDMICWLVVISLHIAAACIPLMQLKSTLTALKGNGMRRSSDILPAKHFFSREKMIRAKVSVSQAEKVRKVRYLSRPSSALRYIVHSTYKAESWRYFISSGGEIKCQSGKMQWSPSPPVLIKPPIPPLRCTLSPSVALCQQRSYTPSPEAFIPIGPSTPDPFPNPL